MAIFRQLGKIFSLIHWLMTSVNGSIKTGPIFFKRLDDNPSTPALFLGFSSETIFPISAVVARQNLSSDSFL